MRFSEILCRSWYWVYKPSRAGGVNQKADLGPLFFAYKTATINSFVRNRFGLYSVGATEVEAT